jgi:hypothetical protein
MIKAVILVFVLPMTIGLLALGSGLVQSGAVEQMQSGTVEGMNAAGISFMQAAKCVGMLFVFGFIASILTSGGLNTVSDINWQTVLEISKPGGIQVEKKGTITAYRYVPKTQQVETGPDGEVIGDRYFEKINGKYYSVGAGLAGGKNPITGRDRGDYAGGWNIADRVPTLKNKSGIYAAKTINSHILDPYNHEGAVLAKVELSGRVVEGDYGYRAQYCRILETYEEQ